MDNSSLSSMQNILVIGAHFDDPELGAGGSMAKWVRQGKAVYKITLTDNVTNFTQRNIHVDYESSKRESARACEILGVTEVTEISCSPCTELRYNRQQMQELETFIFEKRIDTVVVHNIYDIQQDHVEAATLSYVAGRYCQNILMYQSNKYILPMPYYPRVFVDITEMFELKKKALDQYSYSHDRYARLFQTTLEENKVLGYKVFTGPEERYVEAFSPMKLVF